MGEAEERDGYCMADMVCMDSWELEEGEIENEDCEGSGEKHTKRYEDQREEREREKREKREREKKERIEREKTERIEREKTERIEREREREREREKTERIEREREKTERIEREREKTERIEREKTERIEREKTERIEREKKERIEREREKTERIERKRKATNRDKDGKRQKRSRSGHHSTSSPVQRATQRREEMMVKVRKLICSSGGNMSLNILSCILGLSAEKVEEFVKKETGHSLISMMGVVISKTALRLCTDQCRGDCGKLHLCRYHVLDNCTRNPCSFGHDIISGQNHKVLTMFKLETLNMEELRYLLLQNDPCLLPEICKHYNRGGGPYGYCNFQGDCQKLHICQHSIENNCKYKHGCIKPHDFDGAETISKLKKWGMSEKWIPALPQIYRNSWALRDCRETVPKKKPTVRKDVLSNGSAIQSLDQTPEICLYHIRTRCNFKDTCTKDHYHLPYRWQVQNENGWKDMEEMESVEERFCDVNSTNSVCSSIKFKIMAIFLDFKTMSFNSSKIRRLSTPSSVSKPPHYILTTEWIWYWMDELNRWTEYGKQSLTQTVAEICSMDLEKTYLSDQNATVSFKAGPQKYELCFKDMVQRNLKSGVQRKVCRRPRFLSAEEVKRKKAKKSESSQMDTKLIPSHWDTAQIPDIGFKVVTLDPTSEEYKKVKDQFHNTLRTVAIVSIERIQNPSLWEIYQWQKEQMKKQNGGKDVDERQLFHGTGDKFIDAICQQNFDWRICGTHGTMYGKGSYFAKDASYSHLYSQPQFGQSRVMFLARVLVGDFTGGMSSYLRPPLKNPQTPSCFYDSCVDCVSSPSIFIIFEKHQIYPEYLIKYT